MPTTLELYGTVVGKVGIDPAYFLDEMDYDDVDAILDAYAESVQDKWDQTRLQAFYSVAPHMGKSNTTPQKFMPFAWDNDTQHTPKKPKRKLTMEEILEFSKR